MNKLVRIIKIIIISVLFSASAKSQPIKLLTGKYTENNEKGIYIFNLNCTDGTFKLLSESDAGPNPSYFCISRKNSLIYAVNEVMEFKGVKGGGLTTLSYNEQTGKAEKVNDLAVPNGGPCFISLSGGGDFLFMANYMGGSVAVIKLDKNGIPVSVSDVLVYKEENGKVSHAHMIASDPAGERVYVTDLGLDRIMIYNLDSKTGKLSVLSGGITKLAAGSGPRHFILSSDGTKLYVICELNSTVSAFNVTATGELALIQTLSTLNDGFKGESFCADLHIGKSGEFLYGTNRGENTIVTFRIGSDGKLTLAGRTDCGGNWPRNFVIDPSGKNILVANQKSGDISLFRIDEKTGIPVATGKNYRLPAVACLKFLN